MRHRKNIYKVGSLRVWATDRIPMVDADIYPVKSSAHGKRLIDALAESQSLDPYITDNAFGLERLAPDGEWEDWTDEEGFYITEDDCVVSETDGARN